MRSLASLLMSALLSAGASAWAADEPSPTDAFGAGTAAFAEQDYLLALAHFQRARDQGLEGPAVHYNVAVCHYELGDYPSAAAAFRVIAERYPAMRGLAQYNLGLVARKQGDEAEAARFFRQALGSRDEKVRHLAQRQLSRAPARAPQQWLYLFDMQLGHDDNVLLLAEQIPLPDGQSAESSFAEFWALVSGPLSPAPGFRFDGSVYAVRYPQASIFDQTLLRLGAAYTWRWGAWRGEAGPHVRYATLDGEGFEQRVGVGVGMTREIGARTALRIRYVHDEIGEGEARFAYLDGSREWLEVRIDRRGAQGRLTLGYALEAHDRAGAAVSPSRDKLSVRYRYAFNPRWRGDVKMSWRESRYDELAVPHEEELGELALELTRSFARGWQLNAAVSLADNDSELATVAYDRNRISLGFTKQL